MTACHLAEKKTCFFEFFKADFFLKINKHVLFQLLNHQLFTPRDVTKNTRGRWRLAAKIITKAGQSHLSQLSFRLFGDRRYGCQWRSHATGWPGKGLSFYQGMMVVNNPLIRPYLLGKRGIGGKGPLDFHERWKNSDTTLSTHTQSEVYGRFGKGFYGSLSGNAPSI